MSKITDVVLDGWKDLYRGANARADLWEQTAKQIADDAQRIAGQRDEAERQLRNMIEAAEALLESPGQKSALAAKIDLADTIKIAKERCL